MKSGVKAMEGCRAEFNSHMLLEGGGRVAFVAEVFVAIETPGLPPDSLGCGLKKVNGLVYLFASDLSLGKLWGFI